MLLLTWHGTVVCLREAGGGLVHLPPGQAGPSAALLDLAVPATPPAAPHRADTSLGPLTVHPGPTGRGVALSRFGRFLCADANLAEMAFDRDAANLWETFLPLTAQDLADLEYILGHRWIDLPTRQVTLRRTIRLASEFRLVLGANEVDLAARLPFRPQLPQGMPYAPPQRLRLEAVVGAPDLVSAQPDGSALLPAAGLTARANVSARVMALAAHRTLRGLEPEPEELDRDVAFLLANGGPAALSDLLETLSPAAQPGWAEPLPDPDITCPVISLGTQCLTACVLRRAGISQVPMPFDWLRSSPALVRHVLEDDFAMLMDPAQHESLTGQGGYREPAAGATHAGYLALLGIGRVFNHHDPTRPADARYLQACIDRFRDVAASDTSKIFVQVVDAGTKSATDFLATAAVLDRITPNAVFVQVSLEAADRRRAVPLLALATRQGAHVHYRMSPISTASGEDFRSRADRDFLAAIIRAHAVRPVTAAATARLSRIRLSEAILQFGRGPPPAEVEAGRTMLQMGNDGLQSFLRSLLLPERARFVAYDRRSVDANVSADTALIEIGGGGITAGIDLTGRDLWMLMQRLLPVLFLIEEMRLLADITPAPFLVEAGDAAYRADSVGFCSNNPAACLIPDSEFVATAGYEAERQLAGQMATLWADRRRIVFWRGATTGIVRRDPPAGMSDDFTWLQRLDMVQRARRSPHARLYDVGISNIVQLREDIGLAARIEAADLMRPRAHRSAFLECRAILVVDGNTNAWSALFCALLSGACVIKVESERGFRQWYYDRLEPWIHFVPVLSDLSDMDDVVAWVMSHDEDAQAIGQAGRALAEGMTFESEIGLAAKRMQDWLGSRGEC